MVAERGDGMVGCAERLCGQPAERSSERHMSETKGEQIVGVYVWHTVEQATEVPENGTLQSTAERIPDVPVPKTVPRDEVQQWTEERISDIPDPQAVEGLVEALELRVVEKTDEKTVEVPQAQPVDKAVGTPVAVRRQVPMIQTVNEEEVHESADDGGPNVFGRGKFGDVEVFQADARDLRSKERALDTKQRETEHSYEDSGETRG